MEGAAISRASKDGQEFDKRAENNPERGNGGCKGTKALLDGPGPPTCAGYGERARQAAGKLT